MSKEIYEEVKEWVSGKPDGSEPYGKLGALPQYVRTKIKELCLFAESADKIIISNLTPPNEQEVCEALKNYFGFDYYYQDMFFYKSDGIKYIYPLTIGGFTEIQLYDGHLPPHLITMIGRFYEGKVKE